MYCNIGATSEHSDGFVGCIRAFVLNGVPVDLVHEVTKNPWGLYGVGVGCQGKCPSNPCQNGGVCQEGYDSFTCDCRQVFNTGSTIFCTKHILHILILFSF